MQLFAECVYKSVEYGERAAVMRETAENGAGPAAEKKGRFEISQ